MESSSSSVTAMAGSPPRQHRRPQPVMSLLEKYSSIHQGIDQAREETAKVQGLIEQTNLEVDRLRKERRSMEDAIQRAESERQEALSKVETLQSRKTVAISELDDSKRKLESAKKVPQDYRDEFLRESRSFRSACKILIVRAGLLGLNPRAPLQAYATVKAGRSQTDEKQGQETLDFVGFDDENDSEYDEIIKGSIENLKAAKESVSRAEHDKDGLSSKKRALLEKGESRRNRKRQLQSQLMRIQTDVEELEASIGAAEEESKEARVMGANFERDVRRRKERQANGASSRPSVQQGPRRATPVTINPYRKDTSSNVAATAASVTVTPGQVTTPGMSTSIRAQNQRLSQPSHWSSTQQPVGTNSQHPHRVGRIRSNRHFGSFGSSLQISVNPTLPVPQMDTRLRNSQQVAPATSTKRRQSVTPGAPKRITKAANQQDLGDDTDDSEDDTDILGFAPFGT